ncbi:UDP-N-acetylglucosamine 2-epimerase, partial [Acinetobacter baumannii]
NLIAEGISPELITVTGNTGIDALLQAARILDEDAGRNEAVIRELVARGLTFLSTGDQAKNVVVVTAHRRENFGEGIESICKVIVALAIRYP